jgi:glycine cleavage system aminomethyltransferase T
MVFPHQPLESSRNMVRSPFHDALTALGAAWSVAGCHERPEWFGDGTHPPGSWGEQGWHQHTRDECLAARSASAIFDQSSFTKIIVHGPDAEAVMQRVCSASVARAVNRCVYTLMLNSEGGIESECTVTRLAADRFLVVSGSAMRVKDAHWIKRAIGQSESVSVDDVTEKYGVLGVYGPAARSLLETVVGTDFSDEEMPAGWARELDVHGVAVMFMRTAYTGEIGWELYIPTEGSVEDAVRVHTAIAEVGDAFGLRHGGAHALDTLRLEAGHPRWGADISAAETPAEVALGHAVSPKKLAFAGRDALAEAPLLKRLQLFRVDGITGPGNPYLLAGEPVYGADGTTVVGEVTSSSYSFCFGGLYAFAHVDAAVDTSTATGLTVRSTVHGSAYDVPDGNHPLTPMTKSPLAAARHAATQ